MIAFTDNPITKLERNLPFAEYKARPGISQSFLKTFDTDLGGCPALARHNYLHPDDTKPPTDALEDGSAYHAFVLQPKSFAKFYTVVTAEMEAEFLAEAQLGQKGKKSEKFSRSLGVYKAWETAQREVGKTVISQARAAELQRMADSLHSNRDVSEYLTQGEPEVSAFTGFETPSGSLQVKARFDLLPAGDAIIDLKSCRTANPREFARQVAQLGYDVQAGVYLDVARQNGQDKRKFAFLAQDKFPPYLSCLHWLGEDWLRYGRIRYRKILLDVAEAIRLNLWPGYGSGELFPPPWLEKEIEAIAA